MKYRFKPSNTFEAIQLKKGNLFEVLAFVNQSEDYSENVESTYQENGYLYLRTGDSDVIAPLGSWIVMFTPNKFEFMTAAQFLNDCEVVPL